MRERLETLLVVVGEGRVVARVIGGQKALWTVGVWAVEVLRRVVDGVLVDNEFGLCFIS